MAPSVQIFRGTVIHSLSSRDLEILENAVLVVNADGLILALENTGMTPSAAMEQLGIHGNVEVQHYQLAPGEFLMPGLIDTHNHAPQWMQRGLGQGLHILDWLDQITFSNEARFADKDHAKRVYSSCVTGFLRQGITTASYYGSLHADATKVLADECLRKGQRALIGKCNMTRNAPVYYCEPSIELSVKDTKDCIDYVRKLDPSGSLLRYVVTPRFAITCEDELLEQLGKLAETEDLPTQTHFNEAEQEIEATRALFPAFNNEADLYAHFRLLGNRAILAHCCHMSDYETAKLAEYNAGVAHCPIANMTVGGGFMTAPVREFLRRGIKVGLGTDSGGGYSSSILDAMRQALIASNAREAMTRGADARLSMDELFHMATLGGAQVCGMDHLVGNFSVGKQFDALWVSSSDQLGDMSVMTPRDEHDSLRAQLEKFVMTGDDRNITKVFVGGRLVKP